MKQELGTKSLNVQKFKVIFLVNPSHKSTFFCLYSLTNTRISWANNVFLSILLKICIKSIISRDPYFLTSYKSKMHLFLLFCTSSYKPSNTLMNLMKSILAWFFFLAMFMQSIFAKTSFLKPNNFSKLSVILFSVQ